MRVTEDLIERILRDVLAGAVDPRSAGTLRPDAAIDTDTDPALVPIGVSNRHIHLSRTDMDALFGPGSSLTRMKAMKQPGQFAARETVSLRGPKGSLGKVRVLGPLRGRTQVEVSIADGFTLGIAPPPRMSGDLDDTPGVELIGPAGSAVIPAGVIVALRHIHMDLDTAARLGLRSGDTVSVEIAGPRGGIMRQVAVRADQASAPEMHIDIEEANAFRLRNGDRVRILKTA